MKKENKEVELQESSQSERVDSASAAGTPSAWRKLMSKRWAFPALYMAAAAIILTIVWAYQGSISNKLTDANKGLGNLPIASESPLDPDSQPVATTTEPMAWPVADPELVEVSLPFFDNDASPEEKQAAVIEYEDTFTAHTGIDLTGKNDEAFEVMAAAGGTVTAVENHPVLGSLVEVTHSNGWVTVYQSLSDVAVAKDAVVKQGDLLGKAGRNELEKDLGNHLHFEIRQGDDGPVLNPRTYLPGL